MFSVHGNEITQCLIQVKFAYNEYDSVSQISAVAELNCRDPWRGPLVAISFIALGQRAKLAM